LEYSTFWTDFKILSENNIAGMADALLVSKYYIQYFMALSQQVLQEWIKCLGNVEGELA
jgi:hypothetical protein